LKMTDKAVGNRQRAEENLRELASALFATGEFLAIVAAEE